MTREALTATIADIIAVELHATAEEVRVVDSLRQRFKMDSIAAANILFAIEEAYSVSFERMDNGSVDSVEGIVDLLTRALDREA